MRMGLDRFSPEGGAGGRATIWDYRLPFDRASETLLNIPLRVVPAELTPPMMTTEIPAAINAYSIAVAAAWSRQKRISNNIPKLHAWCGPAVRVHAQARVNY
jgi:hypothetical protein